LATALRKTLRALATRPKRRRMHPMHKALRACRMRCSGSVRAKAIFDDRLRDGTSHRPWYTAKIARMPQRERRANGHRADEEKGTAIYFLQFCPPGAQPRLNVEVSGILRSRQTHEPSVYLLGCERN
jgi:hypothetical protein